MIVIMKTSILALVLLLAVQAGYTQDISTIVKDVEASLPNDTSGWQIHRKQERDQGKVIELDWVHAKEIVGVYLYQESSVEAAAQLLYKIRTAPVASITPTVNKFEFGDESDVRSNHHYLSGSYVLFRRGNVVVRIDSTSTGKTTPARTLKNAVRFARLFDEQLVKFARKTG